MHKRVIAPFVLVGVLVVNLSGCAQIDATVDNLIPTVPASASLTTPVATATSELSAPETAQKESGLSFEEYQAGQEVLTPLVAAYAERIRSGGDPSGYSFDSDLANLEARFEKPVVLVAYYPCPPKNNGGAMSWGITGALRGPAGPMCGAGSGSSLERALETVDVRADRKGWIPGDWVTFIVE